MQQIYQQQMQAQVNTTINNEEKKSSGIEIPDVSGLSLGNGDSAAISDPENQTETEKSDFGSAAETVEEGEEHQCSEECGFCSEEESKSIFS